jgi:hypothetical protein
MKLYCFNNESRFADILEEGETRNALNLNFHERYESVQNLLNYYEM